MSPSSRGSVAVGAARTTAAPPSLRLGTAAVAPSAGALDTSCRRVTMSLRLPLPPSSAPPSAVAEKRRLVSSAVHTRRPLDTRPSLLPLPPALRPPTLLVPTSADAALGTQAPGLGATTESTALPPAPREGLWRGSEGSTPHGGATVPTHASLPSYCGDSRAEPRRAAGRDSRTTAGWRQYPACVPTAAPLSCHSSCLLGPWDVDVPWSTLSTTRV